MKRIEVVTITAAAAALVAIGAGLAFLLFLL
jgi:hypothetical protein